MEVNILDILLAWFLVVLTMNSITSLFYLIRDNMRHL